MRKLVLLVGLVCSIGSVLALPTNADDKTVNATVTAKVISLSVNTSNLAYGSLGLGSQNNSPTPTNVLVANTGTVAADFKIKGMVSSPAAWTLTSADPGANIYRHRFDTTSGGSFNGALSTSSQALLNDVNMGGDVQVFFKLDMPTSTTSFAEQTLPVVITALESLSSGPN
jgi:hypothetical protein